ncbi:MAG: HEPN domain-containing protein [Phycisphaeraceae bacterium]|nr:HEPN domain-containing protein [Phycisphaeraceae bacterium]
MKPLTAEWLAKAEADFRHANLVLQANPPGHDLACFLAQQCAEKYIKACLQEQDCPVPRTHDLAILAERLQPTVEELDSLRVDLEQLSAWAVESRYPGFFAKPEHAEAAMKVVTQVRSVCRRVLRLGAS